MGSIEIVGESRLAKQLRFEQKVGVVLDMTKKDCGAIIEEEMIIVHTYAKDEKTKCFVGHQSDNWGHVHECHGMTMDEVAAAFRQGKKMYSWEPVRAQEKKFVEEIKKMEVAVCQM